MQASLFSDSLALAEGRYAILERAWINVRRVFVKALWAILIGGLLSFSVKAQNGTTNPQQDESAVPTKVPLKRGDLVSATLSHTLDAGKASAGDEVMAVVSSGDPTVIGAAKLVGHIASVQRHTDDKLEFTLVIVF